MAVYVNEEEARKKPITDEDADKVNGGVIHLFHDTCRFEVINDETGDVMGTFDCDDLEGARKFAREHGVEDRLVYTSYVFNCYAADMRQRKEWKNCGKKKRNDFFHTVMTG